MLKHKAIRCVSLLGRDVKPVHRLHIARHASATVTIDKQFEDPALATAKPFSQMPKLPMLPFIGSAWVYLPIIGRYRPDQFHKADIHKHEVYGDILREKAGKLNIVSSIVPDTMEIFYKQEGHYPNRAQINTLLAYRESRKQWYNSSGVILLQGPEWRDLRAKTQKHLMKPQAILAYLPAMQEVAADLVSLIRLHKDANNEVPELLDKLYKWSVESVAYVALDTRLGSLNPNLPPGSDGLRLINAVNTKFECMNKLDAFVGNFEFWRYWRTPTWRKFEKAADEFTEIAFKYINLSLANLKRRRPDDEKDLTLLQNMLVTKGLDVSGVMVTAADLLMGGVDTTSHTIAFLLYSLAKNPDKQEKLYKEIIGLLPNKGDKITPETFRQFHYLKACLKESLRMFPTVRGNSRSFDHDIAIGGYRIPAGTVVFCPLHILGRSEKCFKRADRFIPERWLIQEEKPENPFAFAPFGLGIRQCLGRRLAELEMICNIAELIRNFKVEYHHGDMDMVTMLVNIPDRPLKYSFIER